MNKLPIQLTCVAAILILQVIFAEKTNAFSFEFKNPINITLDKGVDLESEFNENSKTINEFGSTVKQKKEKIENTKEESENLKKDLEGEKAEIKRLKLEVEYKKEQERLAEEARVYQEQQSQVVQPIAQTAQFSASPAVMRASGGHNAYAPGYCTYYVKDRRPDIGSYWGNANQWLSSAQASGYSTGSQPRQGAIGVSFGGAYGHVVYVESVNGSSIQISEMNAVGFGVVSSRSASASEFTYIY